MKLEELARHYVEKYDPILGVIGYGSRVCGKPTKGSHYDFWFIVDDYKEFYSSNMKDRRNFFASLFNPFDEARAHVFLNKFNPNFYEERFNGIRVKYGVVSLKDFEKFCQPETFRRYVKGRMEKPVKILYSASEEVEKRIEGAILSARKDGVKKAASLLDQYTFPSGLPTPVDLVKEMIAMGYRADIKFESPRKQHQIYENGKAELMEIYSKLIEEEPSLEMVDGFLRLNLKEGSTQETEKNIFWNKFFSGAMNSKNGLTNSFAPSYVWRKIKRRFSKKNLDDVVEDELPEPPIKKKTMPWGEKIIRYHPFIGTGIILGSMLTTGFSILYLVRKLFEIE